MKMIDGQGRTGSLSEMQSEIWTRQKKKQQLVCWMKNLCLCIEVEEGEEETGARATWPVADGHPGTRFTLYSLFTLLVVAAAISFHTIDEK